MEQEPSNHDFYDLPCTLSFILSLYLLSVSVLYSSEQNIENMKHACYILRRDGSWLQK